MANQMTGPSLRGLMQGLMNVSGYTLTLLLATSLGMYMVAAQGMPVLAWIIFGVVWAAALVAVLGATAGMVSHRRHPAH